VVVVGIIVALLSLVLAVSTLLIQQNEARQLETTYANLSSAVQEYELAIGRPISYQAKLESPLEGGYDIPNNPQYRDYPGIESVYRLGGTDLFQNSGILNDGCDGLDAAGWQKHVVALMGLLQRTQSAEEIVARIDPSLILPVTKTNGSPLDADSTRPPLTKIVDPWGTPIAVVFPGRAWRESDQGGRFDLQDPDGTIRTPMERLFGACRNGKVMFVSAGPDGQMGSRSCPDGDRKEASLDNVTSYEPENR
jgi:type II secretory pathway pseudopilin PulG